MRSLAFSVVFSSKLPVVFETAPRVVPNSAMLAPMMGSPFSSTIVPFTVTVVLLSVTICGVGAAKA